MTIDYRQVLKELYAEEKRIEEELGLIRDMIPGAELMAKRMPQVPQPEPIPASHTRTYASMGTKEAILHLLKSSGRPLMPAEITRLLLDGGIQTRSVDFAGTVGSTLTQMKGDGLVERKDEGWVSLLDSMGNPPMSVPMSRLRDAIERTPLSSQ